MFFLITSLFGDSLIVPLQEKIDEWKKSVNQFDKENSKGTHYLSRTNVACVGCALKV